MRLPFLGSSPLVPQPSREARLLLGALRRIMRGLPAGSYPRAVGLLLSV
jgi:hypothetical protein